MPTLTLPIKPHANQLQLINPPARFNVIAAGRRFGKTESQKLRAIYMVMQGQAVWWVNPTFDNTYDAWMDFLGFFEQFVERDNINKSRRHIFAPTGGSIRMVGADNFKRGAGINHVFIDEAAFCDLDELWNYQLQPMLLDSGSNGGATFLSSTNGRNGFYHLYQRGLDPGEPDWASWHFTSYDNPLLDHAEIDDIRRHTPERVFEQEYMAAFLEDGGTVFRNLQACLKEPPTGSLDVVMGIDFARHNDYTVLIAIDRNTGHMLEIDRFNQIDWAMQRGRIVAMAERWKPSSIVAEANSIGGPNIEALQSEGLPIRGFTTTAKSKGEVINSLALAFEQATVGILNDPVLLGELQAYTIERLPSGTFRYTAPPGMHDDTVIALALAWHAASRQLIVDFA